jgi:RND family efflux transporter MFP subunit
MLPHRTPRPFPKHLGPLIFAAALIALCASCGRNPAAQAAEAAASPDVPIVAVARASLQDLSRSLTLTAEFRPFQEVDVMAKVAGYVKKINVDVGDRVSQGQLLALLEIPEMANDRARAKAALDRGRAEQARARDNISRAESAHQIAHLRFARLSDVARQRVGLVAQQEVDDSHSKDLQAEAEVNAARSSLSAAEEQVRVNEAELGRVETMIDYMRVVAPFAGVVTRRYADTGSMLQAGTASNTQALPLVKVSENSLLRLVLPVPESAVPTIRIGQQVEVRVPSLHRTFPGRVARFAEKVAASTRTMETEVDVPNPSLLLVPGMYAEVDLILEHRPAALAVPVQAVDIASGDESSGRILVVTAQDTLYARTVQLGIQTASSVEIRSGLNEGDLVVAGSRSSLRQGERIQPRLISATTGK